MTLANYINDLLYRHDCVIVPNFGGFVTNTVSAKVNTVSHTFYPPTKQLTFNSHLQNNDGLLANYVASAEGVSFEKACEKIEAFVLSWKQQIQHESIVLGKIGSLTINKGNQYIFEPNQASNYLTSSFGLGSLSSPEVDRVLKERSLSLNSKGNKTASTLLKYAATAAIFLTLGSIGWNDYSYQQQRENYAKQQKAVEEKIQSATFVIDSPLPTIELNSFTPNTKKFHIVAGAFQFAENAEKKLNQLKAKGFDAQILGVNKWNLTQVAFSSFSTREEAAESLKSIRKNHSNDAWLLVKKIN